MRTVEVPGRSREPAGSTAPPTLLAVDEANTILRKPRRGTEQTIFSPGGGKSRAVTEIIQAALGSRIPTGFIFTNPTGYTSESLSLHLERALRDATEQARPHEAATTDTSNVLGTIGDVLAENTRVIAGLPVKMGTDGRMVYEDNNGQQFYVAR